MNNNQFIPDYMKTKDFIVVVILIILLNAILFLFDKEQNGPGDMFLSSVRSNVIVVASVAIIYIAWKRGLFVKLWEIFSKR